MTTQRAAMEAALEALVKVNRNRNGLWNVLAEIDALRAALAETAEPVAWTAVTKALPKSGVIVLAAYTTDMAKQRTIRAKWIAAKTEEASYESENCEYDEAADVYWIPEGWYECIDHWDEYSSVFIHAKVTHWMPLPPEPDTAPQPPAPAVDYKPLTDPHDHPEPHSYKWTQSEMDYINRRVAAAIAAHEKKRGGA